MSELPASFLREHRKMFSAKSTPAIFLGAFGKHPGWDDHMEDLGLDTESLLAAKEVLYVEGIGGQINSGEWEKLAEADRLPEFDHLLLWKRGDAFLLGKVWSSSDGKGRTKYPMIVCAHCQGLPLATALAEVRPILEECATFCRGTKSAQEVREGLASFRERLAALAASPAVEPVLDREAMASFAGKIVTTENPEPLYRIFYQLQNQGVQDAGRTDGGGDWQTRGARVRVANPPGCVNESLLFWSYVFEVQMGTRLPLLLIRPLAGSWLDAIIGRPAARDFHALLALPEAYAITSEVAYQIDAEFREEHSAAIKRILHWGHDSEPDASDAGAKKNWLSKLLS